MAFQGEYACTKCGSHRRKEELTAKKVMFQEIGVNPRTIRSRTVHWLCPNCVARDSDWRQPEYASPGLISREVASGKRQAPDVPSHAE